MVWSARSCTVAAVLAAEVSELEAYVGAEPTSMWRHALGRRDLRA